MRVFLRQLWPFIRPHQTRLWLGFAGGLLYALGAGALVLSV